MCCLLTGIKRMCLNAKNGGYHNVFHTSEMVAVEGFMVRFVAFLPPEMRSK